MASPRRDGAAPPTLVLLLGGVAVQALLAIIWFVQYLADFAQTVRNVRWLMGSLDVVSRANCCGAGAPERGRCVATLPLARWI